MAVFSVEKSEFRRSSSTVRHARQSCLPHFSDWTWSAHRAGEPEGGPGPWEHGGGPASGRCCRRHRSTARPAAGQPRRFLGGSVRQCVSPGRRPRFKRPDCWRITAACSL